MHSSFQKITFCKGEYDLIVSAPCQNRDIQNMLLEVSNKFNIENDVLVNEYNDWCYLIQLQLSQINKADFLEFGYFEKHKVQHTFHFYNEKYANVNSFYPPVKFTKRDVIPIHEPTIISSATSTSQSKLNYVGLVLPILIFLLLIVYSSFINKDRINNFINVINGIDVKTSFYPKSDRSKSSGNEKNILKNHKNKTKTTSHFKSQTRKYKIKEQIAKDSKNEKRCMIVTGSFKKIENLNKMEKFLIEKFPTRIVKDIHGEFTRIGLKISCEDDTSIARIRSLIANDAWVLKN